MSQGLIFGGGKPTRLRAVSCSAPAALVILVGVAVVVAIGVAFGAGAEASVPEGSETAGNGNIYALTDSVRTASLQPNIPVYSPSAGLGIDLDDETAALALPFAFELHGTNYSAATTIDVSANGVIFFGAAPSGTAHFSNTDLASTAVAAPIVAPFWDDLGPDRCPVADAVFHQTFGAAPNRVLVIEWRDICDHDALVGATDGFTFQARFHETSNVIEFHYADADGAGDSSNGVSATVGIGAGPNDAGQANPYLQYAFANLASPIDSGGFAVRFFPCTATAPAQTTVTTAAQLDDAIGCYNAQQPAGNHVINFATSISHPGGTPAITQPNAAFSLTINGGENSMTGPGTNTIPGNVDLFTMSGAGPVNISELTVRDADGDAIYAGPGAGAVTLTNIEAHSNDLGIIVQGGAMTVANSIIFNSTSSGIFVDAGMLTLSNSTIVDNTGTGMTVGGGKVTISSSTIDTNSTGVYLSGGEVTVSNSTIHNNDTNGVFVLAGGAKISNSTVARNGASGVEQSLSGSLEVASSIVFDNNDLFNGNIDCAGTIIDGANNFAGASTGCSGFAVLTAGPLGDLDDNGCDVITAAGSCVRTHMLLAGSNAIGAGNCNGVALGYDSNGAAVIGDLVVDQRGDPNAATTSYPRIIGPTCDAGAIERDVCLGDATPDVTTATQLDKAIVCYNSQEPVGNHVISITAGFSHPSGAPAITQPSAAISLTINGNTNTISGPGVDTVPGGTHLFTVAGTGAVEINDVTLTAADGGAVDVQAGAGIVSITNTSIEHNEFGMHVVDGVVTVSDTTVHNSVGNGLSVDGGVVTVSNSTMHNNVTGIDVGGGAVTVSNSTMHSNTLQGISVQGGKATLSNSTVYDNDFGGVSVSFGAVTVSNSTVTDNSRAGIGQYGGTAEVVSSILYGNAGNGDCFGTVTNGGNNFAGNSTGCTGFGLLMAGSLGGFGDNGCDVNTAAGSCVPTQALLAGSSAIGGGDCTAVSLGYDTNGASVTGDLLVDQRGDPGDVAGTSYLRLVGSPCDAGAVEASDVGAGYVAVTPVRILDSRSAVSLNTGPFNTPWTPTSTRTIDATTALSGIPSTATAVAVHVTTVNADAPFSWLTIYPTGATKPTAASINYGTADITAPITNDLVITKIDANGNLDIYNEHGNTDIVIDIVGYYTVSPAAAAYVAVVPTRIIDSRPELSLNTGPFNTRWAPTLTRTIDATTALSGIPSTATAVAVHVTTVNADAPFSWLTIYPTGATKPTAASINYGTADITAPITNDLVITGVDANGNFDIYNEHGNTDIVIDIVGYYTTTPSPSAARYTPLSPIRIIDSRPQSQFTTGPYNTTWTAGTVRAIDATTTLSTVPASATAVAVNITTVNADPTFSWLTSYPTGVSRPTAASINYGTLSITTPITNDLVITGVDVNGNFDIYNEHGSTDIVIDIVGYYD